MRANSEDVLGPSPIVWSSSYSTDDVLFVSNSSNVVDTSENISYVAILLFAKPLTRASVWQPPHQIFAATIAYDKQNEYRII